MAPRKIRDAAVVVSLLAPWITIIPVLFEFDPQAVFHGVPAVVLYIFGGWAVLILLTRLLSYRLESIDTSSTRGQGGDRP